VVQPELEALLAVQADDAVIRELETQIAALSPRRAMLDKVRQRTVDEMTRTEAAIERETQRYRTLEVRVKEHRERHERNVATLDQAKKLREATAAMNQLEMARRVLADEENELTAMARRLGELSSALDAHRETLAALEVEQAEARSTLDAEEAVIRAQVREARAVRDAKGVAVGAGLLSRYDRIAIRRKGPALFAIRGLTCGSCDTAIPLQRRNALLVAGQIDVCEACGVLLYAAPAPEAPADA